MGWASGSEIAQEIIEVVLKEVDDFKTRKRIYKKVINALESHDWDTQDEATGIDPAFDKALEESQ